MADHGAQLQAYNNELVKYIEELRRQHEELGRQIQREEEDRDRLRGEARAIQERLDRVEGTLQKRYASRTEFEATIRDAEAAYLKILESSQTLLHMVKRETQSLSKHLSSEDPTTPQQQQPAMSSSAYVPSSAAAAPMSFTSPQTQRR